MRLVFLVLTDFVQLLQTGPKNVFSQIWFCSFEFVVFFSFKTKNWKLELVLDIKLRNLYSENFIEKVFIFDFPKENDIERFFFFECFSLENIC